MQMAASSDGSLYGLTSNALFRLTQGAAAPGAPVITPNGIVPVDSEVTTIQPGEWASIYGTNLANGTASWNGDFPTSLGGTSVLVDGKFAYLEFVTSSQITFQMPDVATTGTVPVVVTTGAGSTTSSVTLAQFAPSLSPARRWQTRDRHHFPI